MQYLNKEYPNISPANKNDISNNCKTFASDIFSFYNVVNVEKNSPKEDIRGLQVLSNSNTTPIKVLVELGFVTSPKDANAMFSSIDKIAQQLFT